MRSTFERIEFLVSQGFLSASDAARKKQDLIDSFCLAPMVDRHRRAQEAANGGRGGMGIAGTILGCGMPMAWLSMSAGRSIGGVRSDPRAAQEVRS